MKKILRYMTFVLCAAAVLVLPLACAKDGGQPPDSDQDDDIFISCEHHTVTEWEITPETHSGKCTTCGEYFTEPHYYHEGSTVCEECGYDSAKG